jgi:hypothetical protein
MMMPTISTVIQRISRQKPQLFKIDISHYYGWEPLCQPLQMRPKVPGLKRGGFYFGADLQGLVSASAFSIRPTFSLNSGDWRRARIDFSNSSA